MIKAIGLLGIGFIFGYSLGDANNDEKVKENFEKFILKLKESGEDVLSILVNVLNNIEGIDTDEIKINVEKLIELTKEKIEELIDIENVSAKIKEKAIEVNKKMKDMKTEEVEIK